MGSIKQLRVLSEKEKSKSGCWHPLVRLADRNGKVSTLWTGLGKRLADDGEEGHSWRDGDGDGSRDSYGGKQKV